MSSIRIYQSVKTVLFSLLLTLAPVLVSAQLYLNEVVASNNAGLADEDGDNPDWIELYNASENAVNLSGYFISDDYENLQRYVLGDININAGDYFLLFASDKDRPGESIYWETVIREGNDMKYILPTSPVSDTWIEKNFDDSGWSTGSFGIGYGDNDDITEISAGTISAFTRSTFNIEDLTTVGNLMLHIDFDDGYVAYLNGVEISRDNVTGVSPLPFDATSNEFTEPKLSNGYDLSDISLKDFVNLLVEGENVLAIQVHNYSSSSSDLSLIPFLSVGYNKMPSELQGVANETGLEPYKLYNPHLNFKLSSSGETVYLSSPDSVLIDSLSFPEMLIDESFGRASGDLNNTFIFTQPTPGSANINQGFSERAVTPVPDKTAGYYPSSFNLSLVNNIPVVRYTTNGSDPDENSAEFGVGPLLIDRTTTLKLRTFEQGKLPSKILTQSYIVGAAHEENKTHDLPVVSVSTNPENLWSDETGIYVQGTNGIYGFCSDGPANWNQDWEIPVNIELFEIDGSVAFNSGAGAKIFGGCSRTNPAKSLSIFFRNEYGNAELNYKLFEEKDIETFQAFVLRNSGNDFSSQGHSMMRDGLMKTLIEDTELDYQAFRPAVLYLNGEYWGIHNIREKVNEHFIESNSNARSETIDLLENDRSVVHGSADNFNSFWNLLESADMQNPEEYIQVESRIDIDNYIDYMVAQIYYANTDWPGNNIKYWRDSRTNTKWRWIIYDTDFGFNLSYGGKFNDNSLTFALEPNGPVWPNPPWSTYIFRHMVESDIFVTKFVNRLADLMNTSFDPVYVNKVIDSLSQKIENEIPSHIARWGNSTVQWENDIQNLRNFANWRPINMKQFIDEEFGAIISRLITVNVSDSEQGKVRVNRIEPDVYPWSGHYFRETVPLTAIPNPGYEFTGWTGSVNSTEARIEVELLTDVTANFRPVSNQQSQIVINEVMYNAPDENDPEDWVELYNATGSPIDISGWILKDEDDTHEFTFPNGTELDADSYLVLAQNLDSFNAVYTNVSSLFGDMDFGLAGGSDQVRLFDESGNLMDMISYDDEDPWPSGADGTGFSLELIDYNSDNSLPESWNASEINGGTPGESNSVYQVSSEVENDALPSEIKLLQNFPNPFNPTTNISFELPEQTVIKISVFDMLGRRVATLVNELYPAGKHMLIWNASQQASGMYIYRLETGQQVITRKMLLIK